MESTESENKNYLRYVSITLSFPAPNWSKTIEKASILDLMANFTLRNQFSGQNDGGCYGNQGGCYGNHFGFYGKEASCYGIHGSHLGDQR